MAHFSLAKPSAVTDRELSSGTPGITEKSSQPGTFPVRRLVSGTRIPAQELRPEKARRMDDWQSVLDRRALHAASAFGSLIRSRRKELKMRQNDVALATGVGRRFLIELEAGKPSCQLGRSLAVADALGLKLIDVLAVGASTALDADLPDLAEEVLE
jgi:y4mF family transcriptional regulator